MIWGIRYFNLLNIKIINIFSLLDSWQAQAGMFMLGRVFATYAMNLGFQFTVEVKVVNYTTNLNILELSAVQVMPTDLRGQGTALMNVMSMVSQMASPYIVYSVGHSFLTVVGDV